MEIILISKKRNFSHNIRVSPGLIIFGAIILGVILISTVFLFLHNTKTVISKMKIASAAKEHRSLISQLDSLTEVIRGIQQGFREAIAQDNRQRTYLQLDHIHPDVWAMGIGGHEYEALVRNLSNYPSHILAELFGSIAILHSQGNLRAKSIGELEAKIEANRYLWAHIPSVNPIPGRRIGSGFGYRVDPIDKTVRMHTGVDLGAPIGTPIMATADGTVLSAGWNMGFGLDLVIDHGFGFQTRYAHCHTILVKPGDMVKRGQVVATVGATGRTTSPHLHYEVIVSGIKVNPADYIDFTNVVFD